MLGAGNVCCYGEDNGLVMNGLGFGIIVRTSERIYMGLTAIRLLR